MSRIKVTEKAEADTLRHSCIDGRVKGVVYACATRNRGSAPRAQGCTTYASHKTYDPSVRVDVIGRRGGLNRRSGAS